jgi:hypothetical protein
VLDNENHSPVTPPDICGQMYLFADQLAIAIKELADQAVARAAERANFLQAGATNEQPRDITSDRG